MNLAAGVNETGSSENVVWVNAERHLLSTVQFEFDRLDAKKPWHIFSTGFRTGASGRVLCMSRQSWSYCLRPEAFRERRNW